MKRNDAHTFLKLYLEFIQNEHIKITDCDPALGEVEIEIKTPDSWRKCWTDLESAAKMIASASK